MCTYRISVFHEICKTKGNREVSNAKRACLGPPTPASQGLIPEGKGGDDAEDAKPTSLLGSQVYGSFAQTASPGPCGSM